MSYRNKKETTLDNLALMVVKGFEETTKSFEEIAKKR